jgi:hypothetical protein
MRVVRSFPEYLKQCATTIKCLESTGNAGGCLGAQQNRFLRQQATSGKMGSQIAMRSAYDCAAGPDAERKDMLSIFL